jgi:hypothetical protein
MLVIKIKDNIVISDDIAGAVQQQLADTVVATLASNPNINVPEDQLEVEITTYNP